MGLLERWDRHNQEVMDRDRTRDITEWTVGGALLIAFNLLWFVDDLPRPIAFAAQALILLVAVIGVVRIVQRNRERSDDPRIGSDDDAVIDESRRASAGMAAVPDRSTGGVDR